MISNLQITNNPFVYLPEQEIGVAPVILLCVERMINLWNRIRIIKNDNRGKVDY